jgi:hypothetical protein
MWINDGVMINWEIQTKKLCSNATLTTISRTWSYMGFNQALRSEKPSVQQPVCLSFIRYAKFENLNDWQTNWNRPICQPIKKLTKWLRIMLYFSILLHCIELTYMYLAQSKCNVFQCSYIGHYFSMCSGQNWPSSGVQIVVKDSTAL